MSAKHKIRDIVLTGDSFFSLSSKNLLRNPGMMVISSHSEGKRPDTVPTPTHPPANKMRRKVISQNGLVFILP
jgi:hypothetical protein